MTLHEFSIAKNEAGERLDKFLAVKFRTQNISRAAIKRLIAAGSVKVGGKVVKPKHLLKEGDGLRVEIAEKKEEKIHPDASIKFDIVYENDDFLVLNKPAGLLTHPTPTQKNGTLVNGLLAYFPPIKDIGDPSKSPGHENLRPGIVHRLDKETSGLMIVAKNQKTFDFFKKQFQERNIEKRYLALVFGIPARSEGEIMLPIGKSKKFGRQSAGFKAKKTRPALTEFKVLQEFKDRALLEVLPKTGRTHQIRVHLASIGHPLVGDRLYAAKNFAAEERISRQFLHAYYLKFTAPGGAIMQFQIELPSDLREYLESLEKTAGS